MAKDDKSGGVSLAIGLAAGIAVAAAGLFMSGEFPDIPGFQSAEAEGSADVSAVSRPLADGQNITIITGSNSPVTLNIGPSPTEVSTEVEADADPPPVESGTSESVSEAVSEVSALDIAREKIQEHEGFSEAVYELYGYDHVCFGHQVLPDESRDNRSRDECLAILDDDLALAEMAAGEFATGAWREMTPDRQAVLIELGYVLGWSGLFGFENLRMAVQRADWSVAADELNRSLLPEQVGHDRVSDWQARLLRG